MSTQKTLFSSFEHVDLFPMHSWYLDHMTRIAGIDEAGRGPLAGPVVAAAVVLDQVLRVCLHSMILKSLLKKAKLAFEQIHEQAIVWVLVLWALRRSRHSTFLGQLYGA